MTAAALRCVSLSGALLRYADGMPKGPDSRPARNRATDAFERRVARALGEHPHAEATLLVACSGGPDSSAALVAVARAAASPGAEVVAANFDHGLRPAAETAADRAHVEALAACLGLRVLAGRAREDAGHAEAAARDARYRWLAGAAREVGAAGCVTGHTLDDQAETVLLRLTRGSGLAGAAAMAADALWPVPSAMQSAAAAAPAPLRLLRPLLDVTRADVEGYLDALGLRELGLEPRADPTNKQIAFDRNRIRRRVLPELRAINPRAAEALARFAAHARRDDAALEAWAAREAEALLCLEGGLEGGLDGGAIRLDRRALARLPQAVALRVLRLAATRAGIALDAGQAEGVLATCGRRGARLDLRGGAAWTDAATLWLRRTDAASADIGAT